MGLARLGCTQDRVAFLGRSLCPELSPVGAPESQLQGKATFPASRTVANLPASAPGLRSRGEACVRQASGVGMGASRGALAPAGSCSSPAVPRLPETLAGSGCGVVPEDVQGEDAGWQGPGVRSWGSLVPETTHLALAWAAEAEWTPCSGPLSLRPSCWKVTFGRLERHRRLDL